DWSSAVCSSDRALPQRLPSRSSRPSAAPAPPQFPPFRSACSPAVPALPKRLPSGSARSSAERVAHTRQSLAGSMIVGPGIPAATDEPRDGDDESDEDERHEHIDDRTGELGPPRSRQQMAPEGVLGKEQRADDGDEEDSESQTRQRSLLDLLPGRDVQI